MRRLEIPLVNDSGRRIGYGDRWLTHRVRNGPDGPILGQKHVGITIACIDDDGSDWFKNVSKEFGDCGVIAYLDNESVGYAQYALPRFFPRVQQYASGPPSNDSVFLACLYVSKRELRGKGIGGSLLEFVLSDLRKRGYAAVETFARKDSENNPTGPLGFYLEQGFSVRGDRDEFPLVRKEFGTVQHSDHK